jgi:hypothetical protein
MSKMGLTGKDFVGPENVDSGEAATPKAPKVPSAENALSDGNNPAGPGKQECQGDATTDTAWDGPLDAALREIRTVLLLPSADPEAEIQGELVRRRLGYDRSLTPYSALSYVWGERINPRIISINGATVFVTPNLFAALKRFRHATQTVELWVDALCINQDDIQERNAQVGFMGEIYKNAHEVLMWLGEEAEDSSLGFEMVKRERNLSTWFKRRRLC